MKGIVLQTEICKTTTESATVNHVSIVMHLASLIVF